MTARSVKRVDILERRRDGRHFRRRQRRRIAQARAVEDMIRRDVARQIAACDRAQQRAQQRLACLDGCSPVTERGRVPGGWCQPDGDHGVFSACDDGQGFCPAPDCVYYGTCVCLCHEGTSHGTT